MNYIGSKFKLSSFLEESIKQTLKENNSKHLSENIFCDLFTGTAAVSKTFKNQVNKIIANDKEYYSFILAKNYIGNNKILKRKSIRKWMYRSNSRAYRIKIYERNNKNNRI